MILFRLPAKDLLRFRFVCKQWDATISDPTFAEIHLHLQRYSRKLLAFPNHEYNGMHVVELRNNSIEFVSAIEYTLQQYYQVLCSCDGLYLTYNPYLSKEGQSVKCVLWNPSRRMHPPSICANRTETTVHAMYYNPLTKDYKIVIADMKHYAVYSCKHNKWGDVKGMKGFLGDCCQDYDSVLSNGCIYWLVSDWMDQMERFREIICYDCIDENFKILPLPNFINPDENHFQLTSFGGQLCLFISDRNSNRTKIIKKVSSAKGNDECEWTESKEEDCLFKCRSKISPHGPLSRVCQMSENQILFQVWIGWKKVYTLYDKSKNVVGEIHNMPRLGVFPVSHLENLLLL